MLINIITLTVATLFTGAAIYINLVEHPARAMLDNISMLQEWKYGIKRATLMQGSLAIITFLLSSITYFYSQQVYWFIGGIIMLINWLYTLVIIMPTNKKLLLTKDENANAETRFLINRWNKLHTIRTLLGATAVSLFLIALSIQR
jgi:hypothetical protein